MANEITFGYTVSRTLTYGAFQPDGTVRTAAGTSLPETNVGVSGYYTATDGSVIALDAVIVTDSVLGVVGWGQFQPQVTSPEIVSDLSDIDDKIDVIDANVDTILTNTEAETVIINEEGTGGGSSAPIIVIEG